LERRAAQGGGRRENCRCDLHSSPRVFAAPANNWPPVPKCLPWQPCFYHDIHVEIPPEFQTVVSAAYRLWMCELIDENYTCTNLLVQYTSSHYWQTLVARLCTCSPAAMVASACSYCRCCRLSFSHRAHSSSGIVRCTRHSGTSIVCLKLRLR
jgi:hypothetical protein